MANLNIETETITKGVRLTVIVEHCCENIIAVFLLHNGKEYRGILLECDQGFFPHGIPFSTKPMLEQKASVKSSPRSALDIKPGTENKPPDLPGCKDVKTEQSATVGRFSYNTNPFLTNPRPVPDIPTVEMKPVAPRRKTIRDIRLRPRQTLCGKCKAAIHDSHKSHSSQAKSQHTVTSAAATLIPPNKSPLKIGADFHSHSSANLTPEQRKRKSSLRSPMVLLEDIKLKCMKTSQTRTAKVSNSCNPSSSQRGCRQVNRSNSGNKLTDLEKGKNVNARARNGRSSSSGSINSNTAKAGICWPQLFDSLETEKVSATCSRANKKDKNMSICNPKPSPAIKISIGDGAILKIPPRLPEKETQPKETEPSLIIPKVRVLDTFGPSEHQSHKKAKKAAKKAKDREKCKVGVAKESITDMNEDEIVPFKVQKKHKKKHRHRHDSPEHLHEYNENVGQQLSEQEETLRKETAPGTDEIESIPSSSGSSGLLSGAFEIHENSQSSNTNISQPRPRLVYTWKLNEGLSRVASSPRDVAPSASPKYVIKSSPSVISVGNSPHRRKNASPARVVSASPNWHFVPSPPGMLKDYPLRSKSSSTYSSGLSSDAVPNSDYNGMVQTSEDSQSHSSGVDSHISDFSDDSREDGSLDEFFPGAPSASRDEEDEKSMMKPLMMKIQTQNVSGCMLEEGREIHVGDIVWGKIQGFPWWPGRVSNITVTLRDNDVVINQLANVAWFGSNTMSHMHCTDLFPFLEDFKARYNKKKKGQYRVAIKQATIAAQMLAAEAQREFSFNDYEL